MKPEELIRSVLAVLVNRPEDIVVEPEEQHSRILYKARVHIDDYGMAIGTKACHVRSLSLLVHAMGLKEDTRFDLRLDAPLADRPSVSFPPPEPPEEYDHEPARDLLGEVLECVLVGRCQVLVSQWRISERMRTRDKDPKLEVRFEVKPDERADLELAKELLGIRTDNRMSIEKAIDTLWYAYGRRNGLEFTVKFS